VRPSIILGMLVALVFASAAFAQIHDQPQAKVTAVETQTKVASKKVVPPKLVLPDIRALTAKAMKAERSLLVEQRRKSATVLAFWNGKGKWLRATRHEKCWEVPWQRSCTVARASYRLHSALGQGVTRRLLYELPLTNDWQTAVRVAQRVYPGTSSWMLSISDREGGWSAWVWYGGRTWNGYHVGDDFLGADTVGGWMQFRFSTFAPYYRGMVKDLKARGYTLPPFPNRGGPAIYQPWLDPLGQALTAGYMKYYDKEGCHWCL
jgi:hypothetical protein